MPMFVDQQQNQRMLSLKCIFIEARAHKFDGCDAGAKTGAALSSWQSELMNEVKFSFQLNKMFSPGYACCCHQ